MCVPDTQAVAGAYEIAWRGRGMHLSSFGSRALSPSLSEPGGMNNRTNGGQAALAACEEDGGMVALAVGCACE